MTNMVVKTFITDKGLRRPKFELSMPITLLSLPPERNGMMFWNYWELCRFPDHHILF